jgi:hypothetical protein
MGHVRQVGGEVMELQHGALAVAEGQGRTFLDQVICEAVYPTFWKL